ncbi:hypothetical protein GCM10009735_82290 [Actinomadura chokoriensis]
MRAFGLAGPRLRRKFRTTLPDPDATPVPDLIKRDFTAPAAPGQRYVGDIAYLPVADRELLYLATVLDLGSRLLAGWSIADHMRTDLVIDALQAAAAARGGRLDGPERSCRVLGGDGGVVEGPDVAVAHAVEDQDGQMAGGGDLGDVAGLLAAAGQDAVADRADEGAGALPLDRFDQSR